MLFTRKERFFKNRRRGAAVVEFAVAAPVLFLILFGIVEFGRMMLVRNALANAAREGCRRAALATTQDSAEINAVVAQQIANVTSVEDVDIDVVPALGAIEAGTPITVTLSVSYSDVSWIPVSHLVGNAQLQASSSHLRE